MLPPIPPPAAVTRPSPWRMAELEEVVHTQENRLREQALRAGQPPAPPVDAPPAG